MQIKLYHPVYFNEMIASAKRTYTLVKTLCVFQLTKTFQLLDNFLCIRIYLHIFVVQLKFHSITDIPSGRNIIKNQLVKRVIVNSFLYFKTAVQVPRNRYLHLRYWG